jgi:hypothetical protein
MACLVARSGSLLRPLMKFHGDVEFDNRDLIIDSLERVGKENVDFGDTYLAASQRHTETSWLHLTAILNRSVT